MRTALFSLSFVYRELSDVCNRERERERGGGAICTVYTERAVVVIVYAYFVCLLEIRERAAIPDTDMRVWIYK